MARVVVDKGYLVLSGEGGTSEFDSYHCAHCPRAVIIRPGSGAARGFCRMCFAPLCGRPACLDTCTPFEETLALEEARATRSRDAW